LSHKYEYYSLEIWCKLFFLTRNHSDMFYEQRKYITLLVTELTVTRSPITGVTSGAPRFAVISGAPVWIVVPQVNRFGAPNVFFFFCFKTQEHQTSNADVRDD
jgi:hypothetical protein